jgi:uncharacterized membrane protein
MQAGFEVLTAVSMKMTVFWVVGPCNVVEFTNVSEVLDASIIRAMSKTRAWNRFQMLEQVSQSRKLDRTGGGTGSVSGEAWETIGERGRTTARPGVEKHMQEREVRRNGSLTAPRIPASGSLDIRGTW